MVNNYKRKTTNASWDEKTMQLAMDEAKKSSVNAAAKKFGINLSTLQRHIKKGSAKKVLGSKKPIFTEAQELELVEYVFHMDDIFFGMTKKEFLELVFQYAERNNIKHPFKKNTAGDDWYMGFKKRNPNITLRQPEPTSIARARGFNRPQVERFFDLLEQEIDKHNIDASRIYNMDETGIQTSSNKPPKVLSRTGKKQVGVISSVERGKLTTVVCCCNAAGSFIPPFLIFGRKRMVSRLLDGAPPGTTATCSDNGWINGPVFLEWLRHFVEITRPTAEKKVILVMDNHQSHKYLDALEYASQNNVIFLSLAPHTTHKMQPLDRCVYGPLKTYFEQEISAFQRGNPGRIISQYEVARLFGAAYMKAASTHNAVKGFLCSGIWPANRNIFDDSDYMPSIVTERPEPSHVLSNNGSTQTLDEGPDASNVNMPAERRSSNDSDRTASPSVLESLRRFRIDCKTPDILEDIQYSADGSVTPKNDHAKDKLTHTTPMDIRAIPKMAPNKTNRKRTVQKAEILTSTPIKEQQREIEAKKLKKTDVVKTKLKDVKPSTSKKYKMEKGKAKKGPKTSKNHKEYRCLVCFEIFVDPPTEDWIQCDDCLMWAHEECTSYTGRGSYYCDMCQE